MSDQKVKKLANNIILHCSYVIVGKMLLYDISYFSQFIFIFIFIFIVIFIFIFIFVIIIIIIIIIVIIFVLFFFILYFLFIFKLNDILSVHYRTKFRRKLFYQQRRRVETDKGTDTDTDTDTYTRRLKQK